MKEYAKVKPKFLKSREFCLVCANFVPYAKRTLHHYYGRTHDLLCWVPGFRMACMPCHNWIETHRNDSVRMGFRAPNNLFNRPSLVIPK